MQEQIQKAVQMKAIVYYDYGSSDVLKSEKKIERPTAADREVLIRVRAASINPVDWHFMRGSSYIVLLHTGLRKPKITRLGVDVAGQAEAVGRNVTQFKREEFTQSAQHCDLILLPTHIIRLSITGVR